MRRFAVLMFAAAALPSFAQQTTTTAPAPPQLNLPRPSPGATLAQTIGLTQMTINYSRPGVKGRNIFGALVPYGKVWRTGANESTTIAFSDDVTINGQPLPKGTYSLHTIPGPEEWTIIFNKDAKQFGSFNYKQELDALRVTAKPHKDEFNEWLTFSVPKLTPDTAVVEIKWTNLAVPFTVGTNTSQKALAEIHSALAAAKPDDWRTPFRAASYAVDNGLWLTEASSWVDQSIKAGENINNLFLKARLQARQGDLSGARRTADRAIAKAGPNDGDEVNEIRKAMASWK